ncbi:hypothetical protein sscle_03g029700 [Sclerotinia sclerotiorum 1980 UF-70]|uniref:Hemerythrin-like domain-containing protein n=1 Tax=Sclerotinia sclerotiorum (strain ATCC 18683 / 1980 / Ss-1) TaxID=665079 RepID=A0A1D9PZS5_SCLS1|nr:hypothetical protein sscle_03g029700 [Sclerotinia sclerotiorum 1980 UF-70]
MRRLLSIRSLSLFTTLRLASWVTCPVFGIFYTRATRSLCYSRNWWRIVNNSLVVLKISDYRFSQIRIAKMSSSGVDANANANEHETIDRLESTNKPAENLEKNGEKEEELKKIPKEEEKEEKKEEALPKLSAADFKIYNSMAEHMDLFHNHFRHTWTILHKATTENQRPRNLSIRQFIQTGLSFLRSLEMHHGIEEQHIFPILARKMPEFRAGKNAAELLRQHGEIHAGMDIMQTYLEKCRDGETELNLRVLGEKMDGFGEVLWKHLDQEVETLGAENMRRYWSKEEMRRMPR